MKTDNIDSAIDETLEKIEGDLKENTHLSVVPKAAPTQHHINQLSVPLHWFEITCTACDFQLSCQESPMPIAQHHATEHQHNVRVKSYFGDMERTVEIAPEGEPQQVAIGTPESEAAGMRETLRDLPGIDTSALVRYGAMLSREIHGNTNGYKIKCKDCNFRFQSNDVEAYDLAQLHATRNCHNVSFAFDWYGRQYDLRLEPEKPKWREQLNRWAVCIGIPILTYVGFHTIYGSFSWLRVGGACIGVLGGYNLYQFYQKRKERLISNER